MAPTILHIVEAFGGGVVTYLNDLTRGQCNRMYKVYIAYGIRYETPPDFKQMFDKRITWIEVRNFRKAIGMHDYKAYKELGKLLKGVKPDIVHLHSSKAGVIGRLLIRNRRTPLFYTPHGFAFLMKDASTLKRLFYRLTEYACAKLSHAITIACSEGEYKEAGKLDRKATYVNNGINPKELQPYLRENKKRGNLTVCTVGRILPQKNPAFFNRVAELLPNVGFVWIGDGELRHLLTAANITVTGWTDRNEAMKRLAEADVFLLPSLWEGLPISLLEAMFLKKLCIVSDVIGNRDVIRTGMNGFIAGTPEEFAGIIERAGNGETDVENIVGRAHEEVINDYNAELLAEKYEIAYARYGNEL